MNSLFHATFSWLSAVVVSFKNSLVFTQDAWPMQAWIPVVSSSLYFWKSVFSFRVDSILKWRVYIKLKVSWLRAFLWCISQTSRDRVNSRRVRTHEKNSGDAARRLGTIIQSIFCAQSGASIRLIFWKWSGESRYPGAIPSLLENFCPAFPPDLTDCPLDSKDDISSFASRSLILCWVIDPRPALIWNTICWGFSFVVGVV